jgi:hypothetical protein
VSYRDGIAHRNVRIIARGIVSGYCGTSRRCMSGNPLIGGNVRRISRQERQNETAEFPKLRGDIHGVTSPTEWPAARLGTVAVLPRGHIGNA